MTDPQLDRADRRQLRSALSSTVPWLDRADAGPRAVDAGQCDRCDVRPRLLPTCGPVAWRALCRDCALDVGLDGWCEGHTDDARDLLGWAGRLPSWWGDAVVLWWVSTGEISGVPGHLDAALPAPIRAALPAG